MIALRAPFTSSYQVLRVSALAQGLAGGVEALHHASLPVPPVAKDSIRRKYHLGTHRPVTNGRCACNQRDAEHAPRDKALRAEHLGVNYRRRLLSTLQSPPWHPHHTASACCD